MTRRHPDRPAADQYLHPLFAGHLSRRSFLLRSAGTAALVGVGGSLLAACSGSSSSTSTATASADASFPAAAQTAVPSVTARLSGSVAYVDYARGLDNPSIAVARNCLEGLLITDENGKIIPGAAKKYTIEDPTTYRFTLREGVKFWDGTTLTPEDVKASLERNASTTSLISSLYGPMKSVEVDGDDQVVIKLHSASAVFMSILSLATGQIFPKAFIEKHGDKIGTPGVGVMSIGPYVLPTTWKPDESITITRHDDYWNTDGMGTVESITFEVLSDQNSAVSAARSGEFQVEIGADPTTIKAYASVDNLDTYYLPSLQFVTYSMRTDKAPFSDLNVRKAFAHCVDREGIAAGLYSGNAEAATAITPPTQWPGIYSVEEARKKEAALPQYEFSVDKAKEALAASDSPDGFTTAINIPSGNALLRQIALNTAENLAEIGITLNVNVVPESQVTNDYIAHEADLQLVPFNADNLDPVDNLMYILPSAYGAGVGYNFANYANPKVDKMLDAYNSITDAAKKGQAALDILEIVNTDLPYFAVVWPYENFVLDESLTIEGFTGSQIGAWANCLRAKA
ncbi:ABC transporter substrate-binding protein [Nocardioides sp. GY 10127]|uniref:ABC transporter substrate-binding protein n=1 Tax=Nocardioides sp. GY 10127 TaxID=2569762 RepID=UPI0010A7C324|nr:ABC transporter substrate-binding protein [Nocardioides sp. GY 10127]TIC86454.1 ABC transporter substrate-binding protein [Nocardioides sp. GY 10127]